VGKNSPFGAMIHYLLPDLGDGDDAAEVRLEILDSDGEVLRSMSSTKPEKQAPNVWRKLFPELFEPAKLDAREGANRWVWNLRLPDAALAEDAVLWGSADGPMVPPGSYRVRMTVGDWSETRAFEVVADPRQDLDPAALNARFELAREVWNELSRSHALVGRIDSLRTQVEDWTGRFDDEAFKTLAGETIAALDATEGELRQTKVESSQDMLNFPSKLDNQLVFLKGVVESTPGFPAASSIERFAELRSELDGIAEALDGILATKVVQLEAMLEEAGVPRIDTE
jgi:hypothetical protein